jgi:hypothetical protein
VPSRACRVSFVTSKGLEHAVEFSAASVCEAAVLVLAAFRRCASLEQVIKHGPKRTKTILALSASGKHGFNGGAMTFFPPLASRGHLRQGVRRVMPQAISSERLGKSPVSPCNTFLRISE